MTEYNSTLSELLRLGFIQDYSWYPEALVSEIMVKWVLTRVDEIQPGDVLLISNTDLSLETIQTIKAQGGTAILAIGDIPADLISETLQVPIISIRSPDSLRKIHRDLLNILLNQRVYFLEKGVRVHSQLTKLTAEGDGLAGLTRAISELSGRGVVVQDKRLGILAEYPSSSLLSVWEDVLELIVKQDNFPLTPHEA